MATLRLLLVAALLALPLWVASTAPGHACSCGIVPFNEAVASAEAIVVGTVVDIRSVRFDVPGHQDWGIISAEAEEYLKGSGPDIVDHIRPNGIADCGVSGDIGSRELLFLSYRKHGYYTTSFCNGSEVLLPENEERNGTYLADVRAAVAANAAGLPPTGSGPSRHATPIVPLLAASALAGLGLAANAAFVLRRWPR